MDTSPKTTEDDLPLVPKVSALVVSYNNVEALRRAITALEASKEREHLEILVVDKGSQDGSQQIDADWPGVTMLRLPRNFGATKAWNIGTRTAKGELIFFLDPEVEVAPDTVSRLAKLLDEDSTVVVACPLLTDSDSKPIPQIDPLPTPESLFAAWKSGPARKAAEIKNDEPLRVDFPLRSAMMVRKTFVQGMNFFDERYGEHGADAELAWQVRRAAKKAVIVPGAKATYTPSDLWERLSPGGRATLSADLGLSSGAWVSKHRGMLAGLMFWLKVVLSSLAGLLSFSDFGFHWTRLVAVASMQKVDGSQGYL